MNTIPAQDKAQHELNELENSERELRHLEQVNPHKRWGRAWIWASFPYYGLWAFFIYVLSCLAPAMGRRYKAGYLRTYFRNFFEMRGAFGYASALPIPLEVERPILVLGARYHDLSPMYVYTLFSFPIIVPKKWSLKIAFSDTISYEDAPLASNLENIRQLLEAGHSVYAHINHGILDEKNPQSLYTHRALATVLTWDVDIYFLSLSGFENYKFTSFKNPILIQHQLCALNSVLPLKSDRDGPALYKKMAAFFGFNRVRVVGK